MVHRLRCSAPLKHTRTWPPTVRLRRKRASKGSAEAPCARSPSSLGSTYSIQTAESSQMNCEIHDSLHILYSADINSDPKVSRHQCLNELDGLASVGRPIGHNATSRYVGGLIQPRAFTLLFEWMLPRSNTIVFGRRRLPKVQKATVQGYGCISWVRYSRWTATC